MAAHCFYSAAPLSPLQYPRIPKKSCLFSTEVDSSISAKVDLTAQASRTRPGVEAPAVVNGDCTRVYAISDLHTDYSENLCWVNSLSSQRNGDVLIVAGDVAETCDNFFLTMSVLKDKFERVFFVPGNHDLWLRREKIDFLDSLDKLDKLLDICEKIGVETKPSIVGGLGIIPLYSWYHESFDEERDITGYRIPSLEMACKDFHVCKWPDKLKSGETSLALYFDSLNDKNCNIIDDIITRCSQIISFSHFVPRQELCPEKRMLFYPNLQKIIGSKYLEKRIGLCTEQKGTYQHVMCLATLIFVGMLFLMVSGISGRKYDADCFSGFLCQLYVQAPLAYPRERRRRMNGGEEWLPFCVYSSGNFAERLSPCYWSDYYSTNPRMPHITQLAPWVAKYYSKAR